LYENDANLAQQVGSNYEASGRLTFRKQCKFLAHGIGCARRKQLTEISLKSYSVSRRQFRERILAFLL
jgi:hypothetical protein